MTDQGGRAAERLSPDDPSSTKDGDWEFKTADDLHDQERRVRLEHDQSVVDALRADGFTGSEYETFKEGLARYGYPVLRGWIRTGRIYELTTAIGRPVKCPDHLRAHLASRDGADDRDQLAGDVVVAALDYFHRGALRRGKWSASGGASLTTFFVGACVKVFANTFRKWVQQHKAGRDAVPSEAVTSAGRGPLGDRLTDDPVDVIIAEETLREIRANISQKQGYALERMARYRASNDDIAEEDGISVPAATSLVHRARTSARRVLGRSR